MYTNVFKVCLQISTLIIVMTCKVNSAKEVGNIMSVRNENVINIFVYYEPANLFEFDFADVHGGGNSSCCASSI